VPTLTDQRATIDALDAQLVDLIRQRLAVSHEIQQQRLAAGGPRVVHAREADVVARWRAELGAPGSRIALALLELARGSVVAS
jgi:chorismate mutase